MKPDYLKQISFYINQPRKFLGKYIGPKVLVVSVPKCGTNMLVHTLCLFPTLRSGGTLTNPMEEIKWERARSIRRGQVFSMHVIPSLVLDHHLEENDIRVVFIIRDPRDVALSLMYYILVQPKHPHHDFYHALQDKSEQLKITLLGYQGRSPYGDEIWIGSIFHHFHIMIPWIHHPSCLTIKFEDLVGPLGGGTLERQQQTILNLSRHLQIRLKQSEVEHISQNVFTNRTATFREGKTGGWRNGFSPEHLDAFYEVSGSLLTDLGYEP